MVYLDPVIEDLENGNDIIIDYNGNKHTISKLGEYEYFSDYTGGSLQDAQLTIIDTVEQMHLDSGVSRVDEFDIDISVNAIRILFKPKDDEK